MIIAEILRQAKSQLSGSEPDFLGIEVLLAYAIGQNREYLLAHPEREVEQNLMNKFFELFDRFFAGEPVAYLINNKEFYGLNFYVDKRVLVPRPETELLVDKVVQFAETARPAWPLTILDVGTGSGCIAVSIAKKLPNAQVTAVDVSTEALEVAQLNAHKYKLSDRIRFTTSDLLTNIEGPFDVIVANLPYIGEERHRYVSKEALDYEPHVALFGGFDGLQLYTKLFDQLSKKTWKPQLLLGEFGFLQGDEMRELLNKFFTQQPWEIEKDYASIERVFVVPFA